MFELDLRSLELRKNGHKIHLALQPARLLVLLVTHPGELVTRDEIEKKLWPDHIVDFEHAINDAIKKIRKALLDDAEKPKYIETLHGRGYRFIATLKEEPEVETPPPAPAPSPELVAPPLPAVTPVTPEQEFVLPIPGWLSRGLFVVIQLGYLALYSAVLHYTDDVGRALIDLGLTPVQVTLPLVIVLAMCSIAVRIYLLSAVGWNHPAAGAKFRRLFPLLIVLDGLWAASPLLVEGLGLAVRLAGIAGLAYVPFAQRTLVRSLYPDTYR
jgi:DNA-binding winged helix-turn-helix (wHTH) protein